MKIINLFLTVFALAITASALAQHSSIRIKVDCTASPEDTILVCNNNLQSMLTGNLEFKTKERRSKYPELDALRAKLKIETGAFEVEKKMDNSSILVVVQLQRPQEVLISVKQFGNGESTKNEVDQTLAEILSVLREYFKKHLISIEKELGPIAT